MEVCVSDILQSLGKTLNISQSVEFAIQDLKLLSPVRVELKLVGTGNGGIVVTGSLGVEVELACSRCANAYSEHLDIDIEEMFLPSDSPELSLGDESEEVEAEDLCVFPYDDDVIDISEVLRQNILASLPFRPLCREDCRGVCAGCGADLNVEECKCSEQKECDPRWEALKKLMSEKS